MKWHVWYTDVQAVDPLNGCVWGTPTMGGGQAQQAPSALAQPSWGYSAGSAPMSLPRAGSSAMIPTGAGSLHTCPSVVRDTPQLFFAPISSLCAGTLEGWLRACACVWPMLLAPLGLDRLRSKATLWGLAALHDACIPRMDSIADACALVAMRRARAAWTAA
jgi:hypothetical protein